MATKRRRVAEVFPPGDFIREELAARGWSQRQLAEVLGRPLQMVNAVVNGRKSITARFARELELAFGASAEFWLNLESAYQLHNERDPDPEIAARASALSA
jgi:HTH-type transcriptional regulator/antitoxin HigA